MTGSQVRILFAAPILSSLLKINMAPGCTWVKSVTRRRCDGIFDEEERRWSKKLVLSLALRRRQRPSIVSRRQGCGRPDKLHGQSPRDQSIDIDVHENRVSLRKETTSNPFEITCIGRDAFKMAVDGDARGSGNKSTMARTVIRWLDSERKQAARMPPVSFWCQSKETRRA